MTAPTHDNTSTLWLHVAGLVALGVLSACQTDGLDNTGGPERGDAGGVDTDAPDAEGHDTIEDSALDTVAMVAPTASPASTPWTH